MGVLFVHRKKTEKKWLDDVINRTFIDSSPLKTIERRGSDVFHSTNYIYDYLVQ